MISFTWPSKMLKKLRLGIKNATSFAWLAKVSTGRETLAHGLLPPLNTILAILVMSGVIASGMWLWTGLATGAAAGVVGFLPFLEEAVVGVLGLTFLNFLFHREINTFMLNSRIVDEDFIFMKKENPTDLRKMVEHLCAELNVYFKGIYGDKHQDLVMPRICTFTETNFQIIVTEGINPKKAALFISSGAMNYNVTKMNQRHLAALIQMELVKIYMRRGVTRTIAGMTADFLMNVNRVANNVLGALSFLNFFTLLERSIRRSYEYEAAKIVVECGRGPDLIDGMDKKVCPTLDDKPTYRELREQNRRNKRVPATIGGQLQNVADWVDANECTSDDKSGSRFLSLLEIAVRELGFHFRELWSATPRSTRLKDFLKYEIKAPKTDFVGEMLNDPLTNSNAEDYNLDNVSSNEVDILRKQALKTNEMLYAQIPVNKRYDVISPEGTGKNPSKIDRLKARVKKLEDLIQGYFVEEVSEGNIADNEVYLTSVNTDASNDQRVDQGLTDVSLANRSTIRNI